MGALDETSLNVTEFSGKFKMAVLEVDPSTSTGGSVTIDEMSVVVAAFTTVAPSSDQVDAATVVDSCVVVARVNATTTNQIDLAILEGDGTINTQNQADFYLMAIGY